jgi:hypothetical protein
MVEDKETREKGKPWPTKRRQYSDQEKADALVALQLNNGMLGLTSEQTGIPVPTLYCWSIGRGISPAVVQLQRIKKEEVAGELDHVALMGSRLASEKVVSASFKDTMIGVGIAIEKAALLRGEATQRTENVEVKKAVLLLVERFNRDPIEAQAIVSDKLGVPLDEVKRLCE